MFTGIITCVGEIKAKTGDHDVKIVVGCDYDASTILRGGSIACDGVCLTVTDFGADDAPDSHGTWFAADVSAETLSKTTLGGWEEGQSINLEKALRVGDELGGHIVTGHVDGVGTIVGLSDDGESLRVTVEAPADIARFIAAKGSVTMDGASLTVNEVEGARFGVNLIPHTREVTTFSGLVQGQSVNLEIDVLARYVARLGEV